MLKPKQLELIEATLANPTASYEELGSIIGVNRNTITSWRRQPEYQAEYQRRLQEVWKDSERIAIDTMIQLAKDKDFKASKYILDALGYSPTQKIDADVNGSMNIVLNIEDDD